MPVLRIEYAVEYCFVFVFGLFIGSFLNVIIYRMPIGKSPFWPTWSFCPDCRGTLHWRDNVPVASYLLLGRKCRYCGRPISARYMLVELLTAIVFLLVFSVVYCEWRWEWHYFLAYAMFSAGLIVSVFTDLEHFIILDEISVWGTGAAVVLSLAMPRLHEPFLEKLLPRFHAALVGLAGGLARNLDSLAASLAGLCVGAGVTLAVAWGGKLLFRRDAMGYGDVKLMALVGAFLGCERAVMTFFAAPFLGLPVGLVVLLRKKGHEIPYGPYLAVSAFISMLWYKEALLALWRFRDFVLGPLLLGP